MKSHCIPLLLVAATALLLLSGTPTADGQLRWGPHKQPIQVRLIALAVEYPRSSFFPNDEVFIGEQQLAKDESRFIKLVYDFLPYQTPLSVYGLDYSLVHKFLAVRDASCDESLWQMRALLNQQRHAEMNAHWKYAANSPISDLSRRQDRLRCYRATSDDYEKAQREPTSEVPY